MIMKEYTKKQWDFMFEKLKQYKEEHGHCNVNAADGNLGSWVKHQRNRYRLKKIDTEQMDALLSLGFIWRLQHHTKPRNRVNTSKKDEYFAMMIDRFVLYSQKTGNGWVLSSCEDKKLVKWSINLRSRKKIGILREDRMDVLEKVGFLWKRKEIKKTVAAPNRVNTTKNDEYFAMMVDRFVLNSQKTGHGWVPLSCEDKKLVNWSINVRSLKKTGKLRVDRMDDLEKVGFLWKRKDIKQTVAAQL